MGIRAIQDHVIVADMNFDERITQSGLILRSDDESSTGIRPRWARVVAIGTKQNDIAVGQYVMVKHGRWTRGVEVDGQTIRRIDVDDVLVVSDVPHDDETAAGAEVIVDQQRRYIEDIYT